MSELDEDRDGAATTIMVVDDSENIRRSAESLLSPEGYHVVTAADGFEALAGAVEHRPALIFLDSAMPRLDGYQTCALIKNHELFQSTPVVILTSRDSLFDRARGRIVGSEAYLMKPFSKADLMEVVEQTIGRGEAL